MKPTYCPGIDIVGGKHPVNASLIGPERTSVQGYVWSIMRALEKWGDDGSMIFQRNDGFVSPVCEECRVFLRATGHYIFLPASADTSDEQAIQEQTA